MAKMYDTVKQLFQDIVAPQLAELKGDISAVHADIRRMDTRLDTLEKRVEEKFVSLEKRVEEKFVSLEKRTEEGLIALRNELGYTNRRLDDALDIRERLAALETQAALRAGETTR